MNKPFTGGCACGAVRYEIPSEPMVMADCQCRDCQRRSGTGHGSYLTFTGRKDVRISGSATHWDLAADSGNVKTHVYLTFSFMPDLFTVHAASLDGPERYSPQMVFYRARGHAWDRVDPALTAFERMPPA
jgi:hypothetical protein